MASPIFASPEQIMNEKDELARKGIQFGRDVIAMEYAGGIAFVAENASRTLNKVSEIYDRLALAAVPAALLRLGHCHRQRIAATARRSVAK